MSLLITPAAAREALRDVLDVRAYDDADVREHYARAVWSVLVEPGDGVAGRLVGAVGAAAALELVGDRRLLRSGVAGLSAEEMDAGLLRWRPRWDHAAITHALRLAATAGVRLLTPDDTTWPAPLDDLGEFAPLCLWVRGEPSHLTGGPGAYSAAIVGARAATSYGEHVALELAADLAGSGVRVVSGAAYGIDGAAHRAALATNGATIALLAGGVDRPYPAGHTDLLNRIAASGTVVSEVPCGSAPTKWRFLARNRLIAALADATIVVEAGWRSGSLNTAHHAAALGRPLGAVPGPITSAASAGTHRLLREVGAQCITSGDDIRELLGIRSAAVPSADDRPRTDDLTRLRDALSARVSRDPGELARRSGLASDDVSTMLGLLQLEGSAARSGAGWRRVTSG